MHVMEIWRYPVKSMAGEQLRHARLSPSGIEGDRIIRVPIRLPMTHVPRDIVKRFGGKLALNWDVGR